MTQKTSSTFFVYLLILFPFVLTGQAVNNEIGDVVMPSPNAASLGKYGDIPVNYYSGIPSVSIPIHTLQEGPLSLPVSLSYHAGGVPVGELGSWVGLGWSLQAGGNISRTIQGKADESAFGYMEIGNTISVCQNPPCPPGEPAPTNGSCLPNIPQTDCCVSMPSTSSPIYSMANGQVDGEPDIFSFSVGGYNGKFYIDASGEAVLIPKQDLKVEYILNGSVSDPRRLSSFIITLANGVRYEFGDIGDGNLAIEIMESNDNNFWHANNWYLKRIVTPDGINAIFFDYVEEEYSYYSRSSGNGWSAIGGYQVNKSDVIGYRLERITTFYERLIFNPGANRDDLKNTVGNPAKALASIKLETNNTNFCKEFHLTQGYYLDHTAYKANAEEDKRLRLESVQEKSCDNSIVIPAYKLTYYTDTTNADYLPSRLSPQIDHWGYFNGAEDNPKSGLNIPLTTLSYNSAGGTPVTYTQGFSDRETSEYHMRLGTLKKIEYPTGGSTSFKFDANDYWNSELISTLEDLDFELEWSWPTGNCINNQTCLDQDYFTFNAADLPNIRYKWESKGTNFQAACCNMPTQSTLKLYVGNASTPLATTNGIATFCDPTIHDISIGRLDAIFPMIQPDTEYRLELCGNSGAFLFTLKKEVQELQSTNRKVGGLRVQGIVNHNGLDPSKDVIRTYEYTMEEESYAWQSSGKLFSEPKYGYVYETVSANCPPNPAQVYSITHFFEDISIVPLSSFEGSHIGYKYVKESHNGNGSNLMKYFQEDVPQYPDQFPIPPAPPRVDDGNLELSHVRDEGGSTQQSTFNTIYAGDSYDSGQGVFIKTRFAGGIAPWLRYEIKTKPFRLSQVKSTIDGVTTTTDYEYNFAQHLFPTAEVMTNSDGKVHRVETEYPRNASGLPSYAQDANTEMLDLYMIAFPIQIRKYVNGNLTGGSKIHYKLFASQFSDFPRLYQQREIYYDNSEREIVTLDYNTTGNTTNLIKRGFAPETYTWSENLPLTKSFLNFNWQYNYHNNTRLLKKVIDIKGLSSRFQYDPLMRMKRSDSRNGGLEATYQYHYTLAGGGAPNYVEVYTSEDNTIRYNYIDGLGRELQTLSLKYGPGMEDVAHGAVEYDQFGRVERQFQPHPGSSTYRGPGGPHDRFSYESSPLSRELSRTFADGTSMNTVYAANTTSDAVTNYQTSGIYPDNELYKVTVYDEKGHPTITFKDKIGRVILIRKKWDGNNVDTYYQYDDRDNLIAVMPPGCSSPTDLHIGYQYTYDENNRMETKKLPGAGTQTFTYNNRDEVITSTDGNGNLVEYNYDGHGRDTLTKLQRPLSQQRVPIIYKEYDSGGGGYMGELVRESKSILNGDLARTIITSYNYDQFGRIERMSDGAYRGGSDNYRYQYEGATDRVRQVNRNYGQFAWFEKYIYDHVGREKVQAHKMTYGYLHESIPYFSSRTSSYDIKDQLILKGLNGLQNVSYGYDVRGRLLRINKLPLPYDADFAPTVCGGDGGGNPADSTACGGVTVDMEALLDIIVEDGEVEINCNDDCGEEDQEMEICDFSVTFAAHYSICSITDGNSVNVISFNPGVQINDPASAAVVQAEIENFLQAYGFAYDAVLVQLGGGEVSIQITGTPFQFGVVNNCSGDAFPFSNDCQEVDGFPIGTPQQVSQQLSSMETLNQQMAQTTVNTVTYPTTLYKLNLYQGNVTFALEQELDVIDGEYNPDDCVEVSSENEVISFTANGNVYQKSFAQVLQLRQGTTLDDATFEGDSPCEDDLPTCTLIENYFARAIVQSNVINVAVSAPTYVDMSSYLNTDRSLIPDGNLWERNSASFSEIGWDIGFFKGGANIVVKSLVIKVTGYTELSNVNGFIRFGLHNGVDFVKINEGDSTFVFFDTNGSGGELGLSVAEPEQLSPYQLESLMFSMYVEGGSGFGIDGISVEIEYESPCNGCGEDGVPCTEAERQLQQNDLSTAQTQMNNADATQMSYPLMIHRVEFCDGTFIYLLADELSQISGSYSIYQDIAIQNIDQLLTVYVGAQASEMSFADFVQFRKTTGSFVLESPGCSVETTFEEVNTGCSYSLYQEGWQFSHIPNSNQLKVTLDKYIEERCGIDPPQETLRETDEIVIDVNKYVQLISGISGNLQSGLRVDSGYLHNLQLRTLNPAGTLNINLNPNTFLTSYPGLAGTLAPADLIFNGDIIALKNAIQIVIEHAIDQWKTQHGVNALYRYGVYGYVNNSNNVLTGYINIRFYLYHQPTEGYVAIDPASTSALNYTPDGINFSVGGLASPIATQERVTAFSGDSPCASLLSTTYAGYIIDHGAISFDQLPLLSTEPVMVRENGGNCSDVLDVQPSSVCDRPRRFWNGESFEACDYCLPDPPECTLTEAENQEAFVDSLMEIYNNMNPTDLSYPDSLHQVMLCDGTLIYIFGQHLDDLPGGGNVINSIPINGVNQTFEVSADTTDLYAMRIYYEPNGNVEKVRWQVKFQPEQQYQFEYDDLDRMEQATYTGQGWLQNASYQEDIVYKDGRGNIHKLTRGGYNGSCTYGLIDDLTYTYDQGNKVIRIQDIADPNRGFKYKPGGPTEEYRYDANANMVYDWHKGIDTIKYNYLNLPGSIILGGAPLDYIYDAAGKKHRSPGPYDFVNNVHYSPDGFEAVYHDEGRVTPIYNDSLGLIDSMQYEYVIRDHLGNGRVYFSDLDKNYGISVYGVPEILQERHYYPFGLMFEGPFLSQVGPENEYTYNGKRFHREGDLNWYDYGWRWYDAAIGRFPSLDPIADEFHHFTPYNYAENNPGTYIDLWGLQAARLSMRPSMRVVHRRGGGGVTSPNPAFNPRNPGALTPPLIETKSSEGFNVPSGPSYIGPADSNPGPKTESELGQILEDFIQPNIVNSLENDSDGGDSSESGANSGNNGGGGSTTGGGDGGDGPKDPKEHFRMTEPASPALKGNPYSPGEVSKRQSQTRRDMGITPDPSVPIPNQNPGRNIKSGVHTSTGKTRHSTGERNVSSQEEHSRNAKGNRGNRNRRGGQ